MIERKDPEQFIGLTDDVDKRRFIENDYRIRSGLCPNGHGLLATTDYGQECPRCGFFTNVRAEQRPT